MSAAGPRLVASFDGWTLLRAPLELSRGGAAVRLQEQPLQILEALVVKPGELVTREELIARLWPDSVVDFDAGLNTAVRKLRAALGDDAEAPKYLETVPRQGYRFVGRLDATTAESPAARGRQPRGRPPLWIPVAGLLVVGAGAAALVATRLPARTAAPAPRATAAVSRLAVLPFENLSPDPANAFFAEGMHEELLSALGSRAAGLEVISRTTMLSYRSTARPVQAVARELGATHVLEGSVRREANIVRVSVQLVDAAADRQLWSQSYQRTLVDAMTLQAEIAQDVAARLAIQLPVARAALPPPRSAEAYDFWLKGTLAWQQVGGGGATPQETDRVEAMFTKAIEFDDHYAAAYADRARIRIARFASRADGSEENLAGARADIAAAQQYGGGTPHVLVRTATLAFLVDRDLPRALGLIEAAEQVGPLTPDLMLTKANFLMVAGRLDESLAVHAQAARLDPGNGGIYRYWVANLVAARRPAEAFRVLREFDARYPGRLSRGEYVFAFTGATAPWWDEVARLRAGGDPTTTLSAEFDLLRYEHRTTELAARLTAEADATFAQHSPFGGRVGASPKPVAELRGWERLLAGDAAGAARHGRALESFVARLPDAAWNDWWRRLLWAESALLVGEPAAAADHARAALRLLERRSTHIQEVHTRLMAARVLAWSGRADEALVLLEGLSRGYPGVGPATIVRDPLFATPLATNPRWRALERALNAEIAANQGLLRPATPGR